MKGVSIFQVDRDLCRAQLADRLAATGAVCFTLQNLPNLLDCQQTTRFWLGDLCAKSSEPTAVENSKCLVWSAVIPSLEWRRDLRCPERVESTFDSICSRDVSRQLRRAWKCCQFHIESLHE